MSYDRSRTVPGSLLGDSERQDTVCDLTKKEMLCVGEAGEESREVVYSL